MDSKALIEAAIHEVGDGNMYAEKASTSLREVVDGIQAIADSAKKIKEKKYAYLLQPDLNDEKMSEWKSRNLNDMRYISRFMVGYLKENLKFDNSSKSEGRWQNVYAVKGSLTSMFRKLWLNETTWGRADKASIKAETYLDHAVDAVVIGNCLPVYVEIAQVNLRLRDIYKSNGRQFVAEYWDCFNKGVEMISRYYNIDKDTVRAFLTCRCAAAGLPGGLPNRSDHRLF